MTREQIVEQLRLIASWYIPASASHVALTAALRVIEAGGDVDDEQVLTDKGVLSEIAFRLPEEPLRTDTQKLLGIAFRLGAYRSTPTPEMVERAARVLWEDRHGVIEGWDEQGPIAQSNFRALARRALTAALGIEATHVG